MKNEPLDATRKQTGIYASDELTPVDIGDVIRIEHTDGFYFAEIIAIETGDAGELLIFQYIKPDNHPETVQTFKLNRPFPR